MYCEWPHSRQIRLCDKNKWLRRCYQLIMVLPQFSLRQQIFQYPTHVKRDSQWFQQRRLLYLDGLLFWALQVVNLDPQKSLRCPFFWMCGQINCRNRHTHKKRKWSDRPLLKYSALRRKQQIGLRQYTLLRRHLQEL